MESWILGIEYTKKEPRSTKKQPKSARKLPKNKKVTTGIKAFQCNYEEPTNRAPDDGANSCGDDDNDDNYESDDSDTLSSIADVDDNEGWKCKVAS